VRQQQQPQQQQQQQQQQRSTPDGVRRQPLFTSQDAAKLAKRLASQVNSLETQFFPLTAVMDGLINVATLLTGNDRTAALQIRDVLGAQFALGPG
jgi:hypothetical protein